MCFIVDLLRRVVMLFIVSFFVGFYVGVSNDKALIRQNHYIKSCSNYTIDLEY